VVIFGKTLWYKNHIKDMARQKMKDEEKKKKISICLEPILIEELKEHLKTNKINRSKYIENLIKNDLNK